MLDEQVPFVQTYSERGGAQRRPKRSRSFHEDSVSSPYLGLVAREAGGKKSKLNNFIDKLKMSTI